LPPVILLWRKICMGKPIGRILNKEWGVEAQHALYNRPGTWFHLLERFPGALFDDTGYVLFETRAEYEKCSDVRIGKELHVPSGISAMRGYVRMRGT
jgi:5-methylcytosine-specific restriction enzyme A